MTTGKTIQLPPKIRDLALENLRLHTCAKLLKGKGGGRETETLNKGKNKKERAC